jgi:large subunit ribosomal protein L9
MPQGPLKAVGDHHLSVALHTDVVAEITVSVVAEQS